MDDQLLYTADYSHSNDYTYSMFFHTDMTPSYTSNMYVSHYEFNSISFYFYKYSFYFFCENISSTSCHFLLVLINGIIASIIMALPAISNIVQSTIIVKPSHSLKNAKRKRSII